MALQFSPIQIATPTKNHLIRINQLKKSPDLDTVRIDGLTDIMMALRKVRSQTPHSPTTRKGLGDDLYLAI